MSQVQKTLCLIHFWVNPFFPFSVLAASFLLLSGVIRNWTSHYKGQERGKYLGQNQPNSVQMVQFEFPKYRQKPLCLIHFWVNPFSPFPAPAASTHPLSGILRNGSPQVRKVKKSWNKISLIGCKWSCLNALGTETPVSHSLMSESLFPISSPWCFLSSSLWGNR